jgi:hypothetical protein
MHAPAGKGLGEHGFGSFLADQCGRFARMRKAFEAISLRQYFTLVASACACHYSAPASSRT